MDTQILQVDKDTSEDIDDSKKNDTKQEVNEIEASDTQNINETTTTNNLQESNNEQPTVHLTPGIGSKSFYINFHGSIEKGYFSKVNDVYIRYSILSGTDWIVSSGFDLGVSQLSRSRFDEKRGCSEFVWNQPISISYKSYNFFGWPQLIICVQYFDLLGNDQILGYGCVHLPISERIADDSGKNYRQIVTIHQLQSSSYWKQLSSWITGKKPELINSKLFGRSDCRTVLHMQPVGTIYLSISSISKDVYKNGYRI